MHRALARRYFYFFCTYVYPDFITAPHHLEICDALDDVVAGKIKRLHVALPPRHSKSLLISELFPGFWFGHNPDKQIIHASYAASLSNKFSMSVRRLIRDNARYRELFPHIALSPDRRRLDDWLLVTGGGFRSIGVTGGITGLGCHLAIVDAPHKEGDEQSEHLLEVVWNWWASAMQTRLMPGAAVLFPMTRWAVNDMAGRALRLAASDLDADQWTCLIYPALAVENDPLGRAPGEALWPKQYSRKRLLAIKAASERYFESLFQQNPQLHEEPLFSMDSFVRASHVAKKHFWTVDIAITEKDRSDYTVFGRWSWEDDVFALHKIIRFRAQWPSVRAEMKCVLDTYPDEKMYLPKHLTELFAIQLFRQNYSSQIEEVSMPGDKYSRAVVLSDVCKRCTVIVIPGADGDIFVDEHTGFMTIAKHDDCVDVSSVATHAMGLQKVFDILVYGVGVDVDDRQAIETFEDLGF